MRFTVKLSEPKYSFTLVPLQWKLIFVIIVMGSNVLSYNNFNPFQLYSYELAVIAFQTGVSYMRIQAEPNMVCAAQTSIDFHIVCYFESKMYGKLCCTMRNNATQV